MESTSCSTAAMLKVVSETLSNRRFVPMFNEDGVVDGKLHYTETFHNSLDGEALQGIPTFTNAAENTLSIKVKKTSKDASADPLQGAVYGMYLVQDGSNNDVKIGEATSDADGWMNFENIQLQEGAQYYFKELQAPEGHLIDMYRSNIFSIMPTGDASNPYEIVVGDN